MARTVGIKSKNIVKAVSDTSSLKCISRIKNVVNGVVKKKFKCMIELTGSRDALAVSGRYNNKIYNGNYSNHENYITENFEDKEAILKLSLTKDGQLEVKDNPNVYCRPLSKKYDKNKLSYRCSITAGEKSILLYQPKI